MVSGDRMKICIIVMLLITTTAARITGWDQKPSSSEIISNITAEAPFWPDQPGLWFKDNQEELANKLIAGLENTENIADILNDPPVMKYDAVKARLIALREKNLGRDSGWLMTLIAGMELGDQTPSCLLQRMKNLATYAVVDLPDVNLRQTWMKKLPMNVRIALVIRETMSGCTLEDLAAVADKLMEFQSIQNQLHYVQGHRKPSQLLTYMQTLESSTPDAFIYRMMIKLYPSFVGTAIAISESINNESTLEDLALLADRTIELKKENDRQMRNFQDLLNVGRDNYRDEKPSKFLNQMRSLTENMTPVHLWLYFLPKHMQEAIIVKQALDHTSNIQELTELADKVQDLTAVIP